MILRSQKRAGFSIIENVIGMLVVGILVTALYGVISNGMRTEQWNREDLRATQVLIEKMDQLRVISWDQLVDATIVPRTFEATLNPEETPALRVRLISGGGGVTNKVVVNGPDKGSMIFLGTLLVTDAPAGTTYSSEMKQVTVTLNWTSASGQPRSRSFTTFVARYGMQNYKY
jgi:type II secretory pathway pseudopilin PulG